MKNTRFKVLLCLMTAMLMMLPANTAMADTYTDVSSMVPDMGVWAIGANGSTWLIGGSAAPGLRLYSFDGTSPATALHTDPTLSGMDWVSSIGWNGTYWMVGGAGSTNDNRVLTYNGSAFTPVTSPMVTNINGISAIGSNWLIGGQHFGGGPAFNAELFDGVTVTEILDLSPIPMINSIASSGVNWMIGGGDGAANTLFVYDGLTASNLSSLLPSTESVFDVDWNGSNWMVSGIDGVGGLRLFINDGPGFIDLTAAVLALDMTNVGAISNHNGVWLIGGTNETRTEARLISYDGTTFTDLSENIAVMGTISAISVTGDIVLLGGTGDMSGNGPKLYRLDIEAPAPVPTPVPTLPYTGR